MALLRYSNVLHTKSLGSSSAALIYGSWEELRWQILSLSAQENKNFSRLCVIFPYIHQDTLGLGYCYSLKWNLNKKKIKNSSSNQLCWLFGFDKMYHEKISQISSSYLQKLDVFNSQFKKWMFLSWIMLKKKSNPSLLSASFRFICVNFLHK